MTNDVPFHIFVLIACLYIISIAVVNIIYYQRLYNDNGAANISKSAALTVLVLNIILLVIVLLKLVWTIFKMIDTSPNY